MKPGHFEAKKHAYRQTQDGVVVSFVVHPHELDAGFAVAPLGTRYMVAFAQIGDDEQPVAEKKPEQKERLKFDEMPLSQQCALVCRDLGFQAWLQKKHQGDFNALVQKNHGVVNVEAWAANIIRATCVVASRSELDTDPKAAALWATVHTRFLTETGRMAEPR